MDTGISRRRFLGYAGVACLACAGNAYGFFSDKDICGTVFKGQAPKEPWKWSIEGFHYRKVGTDKVQCMVCPNKCFMEPGDRSVCRSKVNIGGVLYSLTYGNPCAIHIDPIEKKPLYHFYPQSRIFSIATTGCNLRCLNCQNWEISQVKPEEVHSTEMFPPQVVEAAVKQSIPMIAYTYSEAITYYEYMYDTAKLAREKSIKNVLVSNGYINKGPLRDLAQYLDGANINLKSFDDKIYKSLNGGHLQPVLETFKYLKDTPVWFEMTTLVVPGYIDKPDMIKRMCGWILENLGPDYPLHFTRFFPMYRLNRLPPTPVGVLEKCREIGLAEGIHYVYVGNVPESEAGHTYCHSCKKLIVRRRGYFIDENNIVKGRCRFCNTPIPGRWT